MTKKICPYLRNRISYDCDFWCTCVKWWYLQQIFSFFKILIFGVFRGIKGKKWPKINNFSLFCFVFFSLAHFNSFFNNYLFSKLSTNARKKFWGVPHLLHMCLIFFEVDCCCLWLILLSSTQNISETISTSAM